MSQMAHIPPANEQEGYSKSGYALSSWNYGSFHHCNPYYQKGEFLRTRGREEEEKNSNTNYNNAKRAQSAGLNKYGKRRLQEDERIVTEEYLIAMKELKAIKNNPNASNNISGNRSKSKKIESAGTGNLNISDNTSNLNNINNCSNNYNSNFNSSSSQNLIINNNSLSGGNSGTFSNNKTNVKPFKFQLSFEEWAAVKAKQQEIFKKVKIIKESEDNNFEFFNKKIDDNYRIIQ